MQNEKFFVVIKFDECVIILPLWKYVFACWICVLVLLCSFMVVHFNQIIGMEKIMCRNLLMEPEKIGYFDCKTGEVLKKNQEKS